MWVFLAEIVEIELQYAEWTLWNTDFAEVIISGRTVSCGMQLYSYNQKQICKVQETHNL